MPAIFQTTRQDEEFFARRAVAPEAVPRMAMERAIVRRAAQALVDAGYTLRLWRDDWATDFTRSADDITTAMQACDEEDLHVFDPVPTVGAPMWKRLGVVELAYGDDGWDVIHDQSQGPVDEALKAIEPFVDACQYGALITRFPLAAVQVLERLAAIVSGAGDAEALIHRMIDLQPAIDAALGRPAVTPEEQP